MSAALRLDSGVRLGDGVFVGLALDLTIAPAATLEHDGAESAADQLGLFGLLGPFLRWYSSGSSGLSITGVVSPVSVIASPAPDSGPKLGPGLGLFVGYSAPVSEGLKLAVGARGGLGWGLVGAGLAGTVRATTGGLELSLVY